MLPFTFVAIIITVLGLVIGSFLNVVIYRVPLDKSIVPRSRCPHCDSEISPWQNIPVFSWLFLKGKTACCGKNISKQYPVIELITALSFLSILFWLGNPFDSLNPEIIIRKTILLIILLWFVSISIALTAIDIRHHRLPNKIVLPAIIFLLIALSGLTLVTGDWDSFFRAILAAIIYGLSYFIIAFIYPAGMGFGDVKLAFLLGLMLGWFGWSQLAIGWIFSFLIGALFSVLIIIVKKGNRKTEIAFGPFMLGAAWVGLVLGESIASWYLNLF